MARGFLAGLFVVVWLGCAATIEAGSDALPSWNDGQAKSAIVEFVKTTTDPSSAEFHWNRVFEFED